ncbi:hypothetical protein AAEH90_21190, partial [Shewanella algae]|uniref:hypothetical protein n=1 Tax=Shewanella algae TaxID=38313 RepID=UPI00313EA263
WFEEGLATLYEESRFDSLNQLKGIDNWRLRLLKSNIFHLKLSDILEPKVTRDSLLNEQVKIKALDFLSYTPKNKIYFDHKREVEYGAESLFLS